MSKRISLTRTFEGHPRTICDCDNCQIPCRYLPGFLHPEDLRELHHQTVDPAHSIYEWAERHLRASLGAQVIMNGKPARVFWLAPATTKDGSCIWLTADAKCRVHDAAPAGCAFFDSHDKSAELEQAAIARLITVWSSTSTEGWDAMYRQLWWHLANLGMMAMPPEMRMELYHAKHGSPHIALATALPANLISP